MIKTWLILGLLLTGNTINLKTCRPKGDFIIWKSGKKLSWSDFKGHKPASSLKSAVSSVTLRINYKITNVLQKFEVGCLFFRSESWHSDTSSYLLLHEQGHFDIGEIYARKLRYDLLQVSKKANFITKGRMDSIFNYYSKALINEQAIYDNETKHSLDNTLQGIWNDYIKARLDSLKKFEDFELK